MNEAMQMGVPCLAELDRVGCQQDLVNRWGDRLGCFGDARRDFGKSSKSPRPLVATDAGRERFRHAALERIAGYSYEQTTNGLLAALRSLDL